ncbi:Hypothetical predicted protein [Paramuricea clavata]|uniref:Uncharacterized protein n=1 Tax=Paramuricea clavata TaxID=317549 RepID=A0A6S7GLY5_PARCT|nr:Hypothetical predicted protein [Paramuricea clavata]
MEQLRKARSTAKGNVTRKANKLNDLPTACDNVDAIKEIANDLDEVSIQFQSAHKAYHSLLKEEQDLNDSTVYFNSVDEFGSNNRPPNFKKIKFNHTIFSKHCRIT